MIAFDSDVSNLSDCGSGKPMFDSNAQVESSLIQIAFSVLGWFRSPALTSRVQLVIDRVVDILQVLSSILCVGCFLCFR